MCVPKLETTCTMYIALKCYDSTWQFIFPCGYTVWHTLPMWFSVVCLSACFVYVCCVHAGGQRTYPTPRATHHSIWQSWTTTHSVSSCCSSTELTCTLVRFHNQYQTRKSISVPGQAMCYVPLTWLTDIYKHVADMNTGPSLRIDHMCTCTVYVPTV